MKPLDGLLVVDLAWVVAGPLVGRALADAGATVVRIESGTHVETARLMPPFHGGPGPENSALYGTCNAGKLGLSLDLKRPGAQQIVRDLAARADVLIESFAPGRLARWGLDQATLRAANPRLIVVSSSINGQTGPFSSMAGYGNVGAALSGFQEIVGWADRPALGPFGPYTDYVAPRFALATLLAALLDRDRTGTGCYIDVAQVESGTYLLQPEIARTADGGPVARRRGNRDDVDVPSGVYRAADGRYVAISVAPGRWDAFTAALDPALGADPRFATPVSRRRDEDALDDAVGAVVAGRSAADVERTLQDAGIPAHLSASSADCLADPQLTHRGHFVGLPHPRHGETTVEASRYRLSDTPLGPARAAPLVGQHNRSVLHDLLGLDEAEIDALEKEGVLQ